MSAAAAAPAPALQSISDAEIYAMIAATREWLDSIERALRLRDEIGMSCGAVTIRAFAYSGASELMQLYARAGGTVPLHPDDLRAFVSELVGEA